ncbi:nucleoside/nucleotide kinase family protein [Piscinibacter sp.]|uniref:nucleoside/nucleotide kinase family protein n=1 Tax=Piscinibacter sp. TaxID=1903157 RepID=UPI002BADEBE3|nr:nucleoside/nucleotide kinase family protein [Albitalea sp.]HUG22351.1 nucleoside/nucleotide kinase family protein [Albitalea sp.]
MKPTVSPSTLDRIRALIARGPRTILGLAGPPGGGKSTLAAVLHEAFARHTVVVPMDGFHLANAELKRLGRDGRKGSPDTFDAAGYAALLHRLTNPRPGEVIYAPAFRREIEEPIAGAIAVEAQVPLVITEGNYLLLDSGPWAAVRPFLHEVWYVDVDDPQRHERLIRRHVEFGRTPGEAHHWVEVTDEPNARLIAATQWRADLRFDWQAGIEPLHRSRS